MNEEDQMYMVQMLSWFKEQKAREKAIRSTIDTSGEIVKENEIQLECHLKRYELAVKEYEEWLAEKESEVLKSTE